MTTTVTVGSGKSQTTLQAAWNALTSTLTDDFIFACYGGVGTLDTSASAKTMSGHTVTVKPDTGQGFADSANALTSDKLAYQTSQGAYITGAVSGFGVVKVDVAGVIVDGMMLKNTSTGPAISSTSTATIVRRCVLDADNFGGSFNTAVDGSYAEITNNVIINRSNDGGAISLSSACVVEGNTMIGNPSGSTVARRGVLSDGGVVTAKDNIVLNFSPAFGAADSGSWHASSDYNATDQASTGTATGTNNVTSLTISAVLNNVSSYANLDCKLKSTATSLIGAGVTDATYLTLDIFNTSRLSPPSIGAHDYQTPVVTDAAAHTKFRLAHGVGSQPHYFYGG